MIDEVSATVAGHWSISATAFTGSQDVQSRWLLAQCCMSMNKYTEAEQALNPNNDGTDVCNQPDTMTCMSVD